jgi:hypothetical protein
MGAGTGSTRPARRTEQLEARLGDTPNRMMRKTGRMTKKVYMETERIWFLHEIARNSLGRML